MDVLNLVVGIVAIVVGSVATWLAVRYNQQAHEVNAETKQTLARIETRTSEVLSSVMEELREYGAMSRKVIIHNNNLPPDKTAEVIVNATATNTIRDTVDIGE